MPSKARPLSGWSTERRSLKSTQSAEFLYSKHSPESSIAEKKTVAEVKDDEGAEKQTPYILTK